jgi:hypothetical protein|tara:strand:- start:46 stop:732 length:687 start_codon:yes stop_codon:yes gene_type:complete
MDHNTNTLAQDDATEAATLQTEIQAEAETVKTYTQDEVNNMMARMRGSIEKKLLKPYEDLGDPAELRGLREQAETKKQEEQIKRGEFEKTLQEMASKKDAEIKMRDEVIKEYKVNSPLLNAAAKYRSVNPEQVKALLATSVRLNQSGDVEVIGDDGNVRYNDSGEPDTVEDLVKTFLDTNPHFVQPTASTTNTQSNAGVGMSKGLDINSLDMKNPKHRELAKQHYANK